MVPVVERERDSPTSESETQPSSSRSNEAPESARSFERLQLQLKKEVEMKRHFERNKKRTNGDGMMAFDVISRSLSWPFYLSTSFIERFII